MAPLVSDGNCSNNNSSNNEYRGFMSLLPFKIINIDTGNQLEIEHRDKGVFSGSTTFGEENEDDDCEGCNGILEHCINRKCVKKIGYKDCAWEYNEVITLTDTVFKIKKVTPKQYYVRE